MTQPRIMSLCSGYGGLDMAAEAVTGGRTVAFAEYDDDPSRILAHHWPDVPNLRDVKAIEWPAWAGLIDILTAGYPCQPFSHAGKRAGQDDPRHLWPHIAAGIRVLRPQLVLLENVAGHLSLGFGSVLGDLAEAGYDTQWGCVRAADVGAPHGRARIFIAAHPAADTALGRWRRTTRQQCRERHAERLAGDHGTPADPEHLGGNRSRGARDGWAEPADGDSPPSDAIGGGQHGWAPVAQRGPVGRAAAAGGGEGADDATAPDTDDRTDHGQRARLEPRRGGSVGTHWGAYGPAVHRWEAITARPAPRPTEPGRNGRERLSPAFVEWMMGLPEGHVTAVPGLSRNAQLKALGNGVVPQQAAAAYRILLAHIASERAA